MIGFMRLRAVVIGILLGLATSGTATANGDWAAFGNDPGGSQFSPLNQITPDNVKGLQIAWVHRSGDFAAKGDPRGATALEAVPLHINGTLYYCTPFNRVFALDPVSGRQRWVFDPHSPQASGKPLNAEPRRAGICRGVAYWQAATPRPGVACEKRVFKGDVHGKVYAIDADTGRSCPDFGAARGHPGYVTHADFDSRGTGDKSFGMTSGPVIIGDLVVASAGARDSLTDANNGFVRAFDVRSGELRWEFDPIPPGHAHDTGAANVWSTMSVDPERGLVFAPTTNPSPDFYGVRRSTFDIPLSDATVAISAATGQPVWHFQTTRHDLFDFDLPGHPLLVDILHRGQRVPVAIQQTKLGRVFVLDRDTGKPLFPVEERAAPRSDIPGERSAPTQPFPTLPEPFARQTISRDDMWGLTWFDRAWCRREFDKLRYEGPYTPPSERGSIIFPFGGGNWGGIAYDKTNNLLIAKGQNLALRVRLIRKDTKEINADGQPVGTDLIGTPYRAEMGLFVSPLGLPCTPPPFGTLSAIDLDTGKLRWQVPLGQARYRGITAPATFDWGSPNIGGPMVTAAGLVFVAAAMDKKLRAFDVKTGVELWSHELPAPGMAVPMTYESDGRQYVVIAAGGNARVSPELADAIVAFTLPKNSVP